MDAAVSNLRCPWWLTWVYVLFASPLPCLRQTWCNPQNRKYITYRYCIAARGGSSHGHRRHTQEVWWFGGGRVVSEICKRTDRQTDKHKNSSQYSDPVLGRSNKSYRQIKPYLKRVATLSCVEVLSQRTPQCNAMHMTTHTVWKRRRAARYRSAPLHNVPEPVCKNL